MLSIWFYTQLFYVVFFSFLRAQTHLFIHKHTVTHPDTYTPIHIFTHKHTVTHTDTYNLTHILKQHTHTCTYLCTHTLINTYSAYGPPIKMKSKEILTRIGVNLVIIRVCYLILCLNRVKRFWKKGTTHLYIVRFGV